MRRLAHALLVLLILPALVTGQVTVTSSSGALSSPVITPDPLDFNGVTNFTTPLTVYQTTTHSGTGWVGLTQTGATTSNLAMGTTGVLNFLYGASGFYSFNSTAASGFTLASPDIRMCDSSNANCAIFNREAVATVQLGQDVNGAAVAQTLKAHDGITGTDIAGASLTLAPGRGTGAGVSGQIILNRDLVGATGTTAQTQGPAWVACPTKILSTSSATVTTMATITTTSTTGGSVKMFFTTVANNGTLQDTDAGEIVIGWNNNAGTVAVAASAIYGQMDSDASGTLATTPTVTAATNVVSIKFTPTWVTIVPTTVTGFATFEVNGVNSIACQ